MYAGVPNAMPICVNVSPSCRERATSIAFPMPKSVTTAMPAAMRIFSGFDVPVNHALAVRVCEGVRDVAKERNVSRSGTVPASSRARSDSPRTNGIV